MTLQIECAGPIKGMTVTVGGEKDGCVNAKGYVINPNVEIPLKENGKLDVGGALGAGFLNVIKDMGLKEPFAGQTELAEDAIHDKRYTGHVTGIFQQGHKEEN